ncbi:hypothetical protein ABBQ32_007584 [Trebouxia sp. C0010 RCD-2024]
MQESMSVEAFAAHFRSVNSRITVGSPIDTSMLAGYFLNGLKKHIVTSLTVTVPLATMQDLDLLILAAEEMDAKLSLSAKQAPSANTVLPGSSTGDGYGPVRRQESKGKINGRGKPNYAGAAPGAPPNRPMYDCVLHGRCYHPTEQCSELAGLAAGKERRRSERWCSHTGPRGHWRQPLLHQPVISG